MRKILVSFAMAGLVAVPMVACDVQSEDGDATTNPTNTTDATNTTDTVQDETAGSNYVAVIVSDENKFDKTCHSTSGADGADIDAVELSDDQDNNLGGFVNAKLTQGTSCTMQHNNIDDVKGMHNGTLNNGYVSLGGGYVIGVFQSDVFIEDGYTITVYEIGDSFCGGSSQCIGDEKYEVALADSINCGGANATCAQPLADSAGGEATIPVDLTGF